MKNDAIGYFWDDTDTLIKAHALRCRAEYEGLRHLLHEIETFLLEEHRERVAAGSNLAGALRLPKPAYLDFDSAFRYESDQYCQELLTILLPALVEIAKCEAFRGGDSILQRMSKPSVEWERRMKPSQA